MILALGVSLVGLQLVPMPPALWTALPGRQFVLESLVATGTTPGWMPLSLSPPATRAVLLALLPPIALFTAALTLAPEDRKFVGVGMIFLVVFNVLLGLGQKFQGAGSALHFYANSDEVASGIFANSNFYAASLYATIPVAAALAIAWSRHRAANRFVVVFFSVILLAVVIVGLAAAASRAGIVLAMAAVLACGFLPWGRSDEDKKPQVVSRMTMLAFFGALFLIAQFGLVGILRLASTDPVNDYRTVISQVSSKAFSDVFPVGSGFGTFVPVYSLFETPATMLEAVVNHAHNDWLELAIEGGAPMIVLLLVFLIWYGVNTFRLWRRRSDGREDLIQRAAAISVGLLLLHSLVDYPLRTPALMGLFALFCGLIAWGPAPIAQRRYRRAPSVSATDAREMPRASPKRSYFVRKDGSPPG